ncbi:phosphoribosylamine-glycine ligase [Candidatus Photodesmus katoptron]|uniref:Phosphoribosylamine--glycine ligase n=1 Tax=Candidatus Photodesmus katoptron Akat1 TaxID=1236703 RepID=S3EHC2_9GAMM|nr:phosphoribosylamine--glycine ligase [Candidatus Photodesmus katoptron]EPE37583.1 phosphoribosylamine--glycine ligase [Candidatus Photodesmus katoptron Akat1]KEY90700.1 phosphoribosylamine-glycine ligase [Candidatus Photodesmus katoptron]
MKVLIIGSGGREHALAWKSAQNLNVKTVFVAPGNAGTALEPKVKNVEISIEDISALVDFSLKTRIDLTIVGPEAPLVKGIVDSFQKAGLLIFGPTKAASKIEGSKSFAKDLLLRHKIPTGACSVFSELEPALHHIRKQGLPIVIKVDGLASGKGVVIAKTFQEAESAVKDILIKNIYANKSDRRIVLIEEFLQGEEASFIVMVDGFNVLPMATSQDYKRVGDQDKGLNTGGMGSCSPALVITDRIYKRVLEKIIYPTVHAMNLEGCPYTGFLYAGLIIDSQGMPKVIEYNCRFGDPEAQCIMMRMESDLVDLCLSAIHNRLNFENSNWNSNAAVGVVLASDGYPRDVAKGHVISTSEVKMQNQKLFHGSTARKKSGELVTNGGRVFCATALGKTVSEAKEIAYLLANQVSWNGMFYRKDIAYQTILHEKITK